MNILRAPGRLTEAMESAGRREHFLDGEALFTVEDENVGVFLVVSGKVSLRVTNLPNLDRVFGPASLLGLPATFTGKPYSLTARAVGNAVAVHVTREDFLQVMQDQPDLCRQATDMLCRETAFIEGALAERRRCVVAAR
jgi:CRP-like cAMP-binding protein